MENLKDTPTVLERAVWVELALQSFTLAVDGNPMPRGNEDRKTVVVDFLANLLHFCEREGIDFDDAMQTATMHHHAEVAE